MLITVTVVIILQDTNVSNSILEGIVHCKFIKYYVKHTSIEKMKSRIFAIVKKKAVENIK